MCYLIACRVLEYMSNKQMFDQTAVKTAYSIYSKYSKYCSNKYIFKKIMLYGYKLPAFVNPKYFIEKKKKSYHWWIKLSCLILCAQILCKHLYKIFVILLQIFCRDVIYIHITLFS